MKKVKIMLTSIAIVAVVGGALAFKAQTFSGGNVWTIKDANGFCTISTTKSTYDPASAVKIEATYGTTTGICDPELPVKAVL